MDVMAPMYFSPDVITTNPAVIDTPVMTFMPPPTPAPQPNPQPLNIGSATAFSSSGTQYAGITHSGTPMAAATLQDYANVVGGTALLGGMAATPGMLETPGGIATMAGTAVMLYPSYQAVGTDIFGYSNGGSPGAGTPIFSNAFGSGSQ